MIPFNKNASYKTIQFNLMPQGFRYSHRNYKFTAVKRG